ncbi:hypothetical protein BDZ88DRAFT_407912 [Geranomyces variabilis]|nr:hypothetical protein BDZ88DRAFT_407912 [Geranomyces variabilis]KAJ3142319.1 hypothetical protein HDU90_004592 [Geranomyces variabilis]
MSGLLRARHILLLLLPPRAFFFDSPGPRTSALARLCTPTVAMPLPMVSGLSLGMRTRTKLLLLLCAFALFVYHVFFSGPSFFVEPLAPVVSTASDAKANAVAAAKPLVKDLVADSPRQPEDASLRKPKTSSANKSGAVPDGYDPALAPVVESFLNAKLPKSITGRALTRVYEWAKNAEQADLAARAAYDAAIDAKAMLFISAATSMSDVIDRYWQTYKLHYNADVQAAAAARVREFLANPTSAMQSDPAPLAPTKTPLCLISTYEGAKDAFPDYATVLIDSVARNSPYANLRIFVHNTTKESFPADMQRSNVKIIDLAHVDAAYAHRGFPGLATDRLCKLMGRGSPKNPMLGWVEQDAECALLEQRLRDFAGKGGRAIDQLRGHWPNLFSDWVSPDRCDSWGWLDLGTAVGNLSRWMDNGLIRDGDILTTHEGDDWRLYLRNTMTVHNYRNNPDIVSTLWKRCKDLATIPGLLNAFADANSWMSITEGCYSHGALTAPGIAAVLAPWQLPSWADTRLLIVDDGRANYCVGESNGEACRGWVRGFMEETRAAEAAQIAADAKARAAGVARMDGPGQSHQLASDVLTRPPKNLERLSLAQPGVIHCSPWLPREYNLCADKPTRHEPNAKETYVHVVFTPGLDVGGPTTVNRLSYALPSDGVGARPSDGKRGVGETLVVKFVDWSTKGADGTSRKLKIEKTWFYSPEYGSIQISPGKIMMHRSSGWF